MSRACCICGSSGRRILFRQPLVLPTGCHYAGYDVAACEQCGFTYADNSISQGELDDHYAGPTKAAQALADVGESPADIERLQNTVRNLSEYLKPENRILDVGCGTGRLLELLRQRSFRQLYGIDQSPISAGIAETKYGLHIEVTSIFDFNQKGFDAVIVCHVLEHIVEVQLFLTRVYELVSENGLVYVEVPDVHQFGSLANPQSPADSIYIRDLFIQFSPEHVNFFSPVSLNNLMTRFGFDKILCESQQIGVVASLWRRRAVPKDEQAEPELLSYAEVNAELQNEALRVLRDVAQSGEEVLVWGAGLHSQRLLGAGDMRRLNIRAFVDSDPGFQGRHLAGKPIIAPQEIASSGLSQPIVISSWKSQQQIAKAIKAMGIPNRTILLYPERS